MTYFNLLLNLQIGIFPSACISAYLNINGSFGITQNVTHPDCGGTAYSSNGYVDNFNGAPASYHSPFGNNDIVRIKYDFATDVLSWYVNGVLQVMSQKRTKALLIIKKT